MESLALERFDLMLVNNRIIIVNDRVSVGVACGCFSRFWMEVGTGGKCVITAVKSDMFRTLYCSHSPHFILHLSQHQLCSDNYNLEKMCESAATLNLTLFLTVWAENLHANYP